MLSRLLLLSEKIEIEATDLLGYTTAGSARCTALEGGTAALLGTSEGSGTSTTPTHHARAMEAEGGPSPKKRRREEEDDGSSSSESSNMESSSGAPTAAVLEGTRQRRWLLNGARAWLLLLIQTAAAT